MKLQAERLVIYGFTIALLILLIISVSSYTTTEKLIRTNREIYRQQEVLRNLETVLSILKDAETGKRGYQINRNQAYLEPYNAAIKRLEPALSRLEQSIASQPERLVHLYRLKGLIHARVDLLRRAIEMQQSNQIDQEKQSQLSQQGRPLMDEIRRNIAAMEGAEQAKLHQMNRIAETAAHRTVLILGWGIVLGFVLAAASAFLIRDNLKTRQKAKEALQNAHDQLELKVQQRTGELQKTTEELAQKNRALTTITACNEILVRASVEEELLREICGVIVSVGGFRKAWVGFPVSGENLRVASVAARDPHLPSVEEPAVRTALAAISSQQPQSSSEAEPLIALPLVNENYSLGALCIHGDIPDTFQAQEIQLLTELAADLAYGLSALRVRSDREKAREELQKSQQLFTHFMENLPGLAWIKDREGHFLFVNRNWERVLSLTNREVVGKTCFDLWPGEIATRISANDITAVTRAQPVESIEALPDRNGNNHHWLVVRFPVSQETTLMGGMAVDITERERADEERSMLLTQIQKHAEKLENRVAERTAQVEAANSELEAFSDSVSHDLRGPLQAIDRSTKALWENYADKLDKQGKQNIQGLRAGVQRMAGRINDLLALSRITRQQLACRQIDLAPIARRIIENLQQTNPDRNVEVCIEPHLETVADPQLMKIVLENLLANSWKFTCNNKDARIELGKIQNGHQTLFYVKDNGVGFDKDYAERLFRPFQRLHAAGQFDGTGIGLATVQRIMQKHSGRVWAEAVPKEGAVFYFCLGKAGED